MLKNMLLHVCCAPCASAAVPTLLAEGWQPVLFFYGGNIHPAEEWSLRADSVRRLAQAYNLSFIIRPYETGEWDRAVVGLENESEGGARCSVCMKLQIESAARAALQIGAEVLCTSLTTSPQKKPDAINALGQSVSAQHELEWENRIWRKKGGFLLSANESRRLNLYRQTWCGCRYSIAANSKQE
ncbi:MAG: epoxyqueuosine reductase QueH [Pyramidobacter sp.]|nr:epoxyqueuosine reductase QueH [Pyramidobacter sp.]